MSVGVATVVLCIDYMHSRSEGVNAEHWLPSSACTVITQQLHWQGQFSHIALAMYMDV